MENDSNDQAFSHWGDHHLNSVKSVSQILKVPQITLRKELETCSS